MQNFGYTYGTIGAMAESAALGAITAELGGAGGFANLAAKAPKLVNILKGIYGTTRAVDKASDASKALTTTRAVASALDMGRDVKSLEKGIYTVARNTLGGAADDLARGITKADKGDIAKTLEGIDDLSLLLI